MSQIKKVAVIGTGVIGAGWIIRCLAHNKIVHAYDKDIKLKKIKKMDKSSLIGEVLAKRAKEKNIVEVYFDRGEYKYHGRVKTFAETLRKNGLKF